jgi:proline-specific peptidase
MGETEGRLVVDNAGHEIYYRLFGAGAETLVGLHGGPGADHRYLARLGELAGDGVQVLLYDQLGSGKSDVPDDPSLWTVPRFVAELETVRTELGLERVHLLGQSWGGMLALQYALDHPEGVKSLVLSNTAASIPETFRGMTQLRLDLGAELFATMTRHEGAGDYENPEYKAAVRQLEARHLRRSTPFEPERSKREFDEVMAPFMDNLGPAYTAMWGPHEFLCTGPLIEWDVTGRLGEIESPALILCGWFDEVTVDCHRTLAERLPDNEFVIFGNSSHCTILEKEGDAYLAVIRDFVRRVSAGTRRAG